MSQIKTYSVKNEARITCPVFGAETKLVDCLTLEQEVVRGKKPEERRGCQACMRSSKCPVFWIHREVRAGKDPYYSVEPKLVALSPTVLTQIAPILVRDDAINYFAPSDEEREAITAANEAAGQGAKARVKRSSVKLGTVKRSEPADNDDVTRAAIDGDMSAAITRAAAQPAPAPAPVEAPKIEEPEPVKAEAPKPVAKPKPAPVKPAAQPASAGAKPMSLLERARARAAAQNAA